MSRLLWVLDGLKQLVDCVFFLLEGLELALPFHLLLIAELNPREVVGKLHERILLDEGIARVWVTRLVSVAAGIEGDRGPVYQHQLFQDIEELGHDLELKHSRAATTGTRRDLLGVTLL